MSIQSEINRISGNVSDALTAIHNKGVTVPSGSNSDDLATLIGQIVGGGTGAVSVVDTQDSHGGTIRTITALDISDTTAVAADVASGKYFYAADGTKTAGTGSGGSPSLQAKTNISPTTSSQTITADAGYDGLSSVQINAMPSGTEGTPIATKGAVSNHFVIVTPSVTNTAGYISGGTKTGSTVTIRASELVSGTMTITESGTYDVTNYASASVNVSGVSGYAIIIGSTHNESDISISAQSVYRKKFTAGDRYFVSSGDTIIVRNIDNGAGIYYNGSIAPTTGSDTKTYSFSAPAKDLHITIRSNSIMDIDELW